MDKKNIQLDSITGNTILFGGVYSNLQALEALIQVAKEEGIAPENCFCTGDIVGYCAQPEKTVQKFIDWGANSIIGNVELQLRNGDEDCGCDFKAGSRCDTFSKSWYPYAQHLLSEESINWMQSLPDHICFTYAEKKMTLVHGSYENISEFIFKSTPWKQKEPSFTITDSDVIIAGHSGLPFVDKFQDKLWLNPGVIGMPANDGHPHVWYAILDDSNGFSFEFKTLKYDHSKANKLMIKNNLPKEYAKTLLTGFWDNMEILPQQEQLWKGQYLNKIMY
ncbi:Calcineurin-like phosphoesterase superfamily domain-containing protein [Tenacibaculum sp. MAR_2009_124]|uniref:metallophosphoesterase family protein n=1 Tax=Tenacibaculum sp. MAR_2009_124 TaxID=1250059 RepID=UPI000895FF38|nr:metallophosphoesterase family protein [Tenacibaculum sp. MAR_2009_124]SEC31988.1 Calcineurin-like phosphoesterase superfamily domain-containing protein [Tenacibaculum sp. MAR_2009_124]